MAFCVRLGLCLVIVAPFVSVAEEAVQLTFGESRDRDPMISPDGNMIAFSSNRTGEHNIFVYSYATKSMIQLTRSPQDDLYPNWSADSKRLVFTSQRTGKGDIYEIAVEGSAGSLQLTDSALAEEYPALAPGGKGLLYARQAKGTLLKPKWEIVYIDREPGLTSARILADGTQPRFSPNGKSIVFMSERTGNADIWLMDADGSRQTQLTTDGKADEHPSWSPDGKQIVFASKRTGNFDIWAMSMDGANLRQLTYSAEDETQPCWSRENYVYYARKDGNGVSHIYRIPGPR